MSKKMKLMAVSISAGIITLIEPNGNIAHYRQRGIQKLSIEQRDTLIKMGLLMTNWQNYEELPSNISIYFEAPEIMGRAQATFPSASKIEKIIKRGC